MKYGNRIRIQMEIKMTVEEYQWDKNDNKIQ